ncbi:MAG TPA: chemotaxis protein CheW [Pseudobacteroides sp.]|jgi:purine-binding chemotaxis protein CheW|nr:chemotaxis protein CheW [Pseudobacteroides sp.]
MELVLEESLGVVDNQKKCYLAFALDREEYGIPIEYVAEIMGLQAITEVPEFSGFLKGTIKLRGKIIPVIDIRLGFDSDTKGCNDRTCIMVIEENDISLGLIVDNVAEVFWISDESIAPAENVSCEQIKYVKCIGKVDDNTKLILDCKKLLSDFDEIKTNR